MFIKTLTISSPTEIIREINFRMGINLIIDESEGKVTGNSVGKTTVLKLIDFCLGANPKTIYQDPESKKDIYKLVKDFLTTKNITITLCISENLHDEDAKTYTIERNFLSRKKIMRRINGKDFTEDGFEQELKELFFPEHTALKPTFRQVISHNIRYKELSITNTLKTLDKYTSDAEYETLYLYLLGCEFTKGNSKQEILTKIKQEENFKSRLEKIQTKSAYEAALSLIDNEIEILKDKKTKLNINENFEADLIELNQLKYQINRLSSEISKLNIRKDLINDAEKDLSSSTSNIDLQQLQLIYNQAKINISSIQKSFEELVQFHNQMVNEKINYITKELPSLSRKINEKDSELKNLLQKEIELSEIISKSDSFEELENLIVELNEKHRNKGEYESTIQQLEDVEKNLKVYNEHLEAIDNEIFTDEFEAAVKHQLNKFNSFFATTSDVLYGEKYALKYDIVTNKKGQRLYKFNAFNLNFSSGKKQGEISCFDIAYTLFADEENMPCMHFLLNDKKELMHDNQLVKIAELVNRSNIQFVAAMLKDKLPEELNNEDYFVVKLSEDDKLFRIE